MQHHSDAVERKDASTSDRLEVDLEGRPEMVLSVLEPDQLIAAKKRTHVGPRRLTSGVHVLLWALRLYVILMVILVAIQVLNAVHSGAH